MSEHIALGPHEVICQKWEETERDWGQRPDGFSLHVSFNALRRYVQAYWDSMPDEAPDEYSRPCGEPYPVGVAQEVLKQVTASRDGLRFYQNDYPGSGGVDGWLPLPPRP